ncbi:hypothetical protein [Mycoplasmopsis fermentans]|nr:hypothetical protein [Mycoplasmopsis fermentans]
MKFSVLTPTISTILLPTISEGCGTKKKGDSEERDVRYFKSN